MTFEDTQINQSLLLELTLAKVDQEVTKVDLLILKQIQAGSDDIKLGKSDNLRAIYESKIVNQLS